MQQQQREILEPADDSTAGAKLRNDLFVESVSHECSLVSAVCDLGQSPQDYSFRGGSSRQRPKPQMSEVLSEELRGIEHPVMGHGWARSHGETRVQLACELPTV